MGPRFLSAWPADRSGQSHVMLTGNGVAGRRGKLMGTFCDVHDELFIPTAPNILTSRASIGCCHKHLSAHDMGILKAGCALGHL